MHPLSEHGAQQQLQLTISFQELSRGIYSSSNLKSTPSSALAARHLLPVHAVQGRPARHRLALPRVPAALFVWHRLGQRGALLPAFWLLPRCKGACGSCWLCLPRRTGRIALGGLSQSSFHLAVVCPLCLHNCTASSLTNDQVNYPNAVKRSVATNGYVQDLTKARPSADLACGRL